MANTSTRPHRRDPLASFFRDQEEAGVSEFAGARVIDRTLIDPNPYQARRQINPTALAELAASIRQVGLLQPIVVRRVGERYQIIAGERRWRAATLADVAEIPCVERQITNADLETLALVENIQREDLHPLDEAHAYRRLMERFNLSLREIAGHIQKSHEHVAQRLRLIEIPEIEAAMRSGSLKATVAHEIAQIDDSATRQEIISRAVAGKRLRVKDVRGARSAAKPDKGITDAAGVPGRLPTELASGGPSATIDAAGPADVPNNLTPITVHEGPQPANPRLGPENAPREIDAASSSRRVSNNLTPLLGAAAVGPACEVDPRDGDINSDPLVEDVLALCQRIETFPGSTNSGAQSQLIGELEKLREAVQKLLSRLRE